MTAPTLTEFLLARIAEDEAAARAATPGPWRVDDVRYVEAILDPDGLGVVSGGRWGGEASVFDMDESAIHIAHHDPARVLAECETKRSILKRCRESNGYWGAEVEAMMAVVYSEHLDYDEAWRP